MHSYRDAAKVAAQNRVNKSKGGGIASKVDAGPSGLTSGKMPGAQADGDSFGNMRVHGRMGGSRLDRPKFAQGGAVRKPGATVNVIVAPQNGAAASPAQAMPPPPPMPPPMPAAPPAPPGPPAMGGMPPIGGMGGPPPMGAGPPMLPGRSRGGSAYAKGGKVPMDAGAGSGEGRLEKIGEYGGKAGKVR